MTFKIFPEKSSLNPTLNQIPQVAKIQSFRVPTVLHLFSLTRN